VGGERREEGRVGVSASAATPSLVRLHADKEKRKKGRRERRNKSQAYRKAEEKKSKKKRW
jgi:hypothetical protein